jgi:hypothetical protein
MELPHLPEITITFQQLAETIIERSSRGTMFLVLQDSTETGNQVQEIKTATYKKVKDGYTEANQQYIQDVLNVNPFKLFVIKISEDAKMDDVWTLIKKTYSSGRIVLADGTSEQYKALVELAKLQEVYHVLTYNTEGSDCMYVENMAAQKVTFDDDRGEQEGIKFLPTLGAILCVCNIARAATYYICDTLTYAQPIGDDDDEINAVIAKGDIVLINDWYNGVNYVRIGEGINTMTTTPDEYHTSDMKYIDIVEAMDAIREDIRQEFKSDFCGKKKNSTDNQALFVGDVQEYFNKLELEENGQILEPTYDNTVSIDVDAQRAAWAEEKSEAMDWSDTKVKNMPFHRSIFLLGDIKINGAMENLKFKINMN